MTNDARVVGLIADTHGLVRPGVHTALAGVDLILHAGDVGGDDILDELSLIAPVLAVRGNTDSIDDRRLVDAVEMEIGGVRIHVSHGHELGDPTPARLFARYAADVIVYGHTHQAFVANAGARWVVNPGAAGPVRGDEPPSVAIMKIRDGNIKISNIIIEA